MQKQLDSHFSISLLQSEFILHSRVESIPDMARYIEQVQDMLLGYLNQEMQGQAVLAVNYQGEQRIWIDFEPELDIRIQQQIQEEFEKIKPSEVNDDVIILVLNYHLAQHKFPNPKAWQAAKLENENASIEKIVKAVW